MFSPELIKPRLSKLDPIKGVGRLISKNALMEFFKSIAKLIVVGFVAFRVVYKELDRLPELSQYHVAGIIGFILFTVLKIFLWCLGAMFLIAVIDYGFQKWQFEKRIMMTRKELKDDLKMTEGDPQIKAKIRQIQIQMAMRRMMHEVPKADVVITNPTHIAIALKYESQKMDAPQVVAKGVGFIAEKIKRIAREHNIPIIENKELAGALYKMVEVGHLIPPFFYQAVAEVLAYVYRLKGKTIEGRRI
jgi:flagellar biosynthetic protein FlhB